MQIVDRTGYSWWHAAACSVAIGLLAMGCGAPDLAEPSPDLKPVVEEKSSVDILNESVAKQQELKLIPGIDRQAFVAQARRL